MNVCGVKHTLSIPTISPTPPETSVTKITSVTFEATNDQSAIVAGAIGVQNPPAFGNGKVSMLVQAVIFFHGLVSLMI